MTLRDLETVLAPYPAVARPLAAPVPLGNAGGASGARFWRFSSGLGTLVLRAWPADGPGRESLQRIHDWLGSTRELGFVAVPVRDARGETIQLHAGRLWEVSPWM